jgi:hypothetical protein
MAVVVGVGMNGSRVKKASGQWSALSAKAHDGTSHTRLIRQKGNYEIYSDLIGGIAMKDCPWNYMIAAESGMSKGFEVLNFG